MFRAQAFLITLFSALFSMSAYAAGVSGASALEFTRHAVGFGPRPSGSEANRQLQAYILTELKKCKCQVTEDAFTPQTPKGPIAMKNILAKFPGKSGRAVVITGHYDTKLFPGRKFVGASDGGSSTGLLLGLARVLAGQCIRQDLVLGYWTELLQTDPEALQTRIDRLVATICTPVLAIFGDQIASSERLRLTRTLGAEVEEWIGSGHFVHLNDPDRFVSRLLAFAARCEATAPSAPTPV